MPSCLLMPVCGLSYLFIVKSNIIITKDDLVYTETSLHDHAN